MRSGTKARRHPLRSWSRSTRRALMAAGVWLAGAVAPVSAQTDAENIGEWFPLGNGSPIFGASYFAPTTRYAHGVLGDAVEWDGLKMTIEGRNGAPWDVEMPLSEDHVFEDLEPRLVDLDLDGKPDAALVIETDLDAGAALALYGAAGKITETPHIGRRNRWLAPVGAADLDGDGHVEIAYIDRPHLAKTLRIWRFRDGALYPVADLPGLTNHRIGEDFITSGIRDCGQGPEMITADAGWRQVMASRLVKGRIETRAIGAFRSPQSVADALTCR